MKRIGILIIAVLLGLSYGCGSSAQSPKDVLDRFYKVTGSQQVDLENQSIRMEMNVSYMGVPISMCAVFDYPNKKMVLDMEAMGAKTKVVQNGEEGWISVPGQEVQPIPQEQLAQMRQQNDPMSNMRWSEEVYDFTLLEPVKQDGKTFDVIQAVVKEGQHAENDLCLYFDRATGLLAYFMSDMDLNGAEVPVRVTIEEYKTQGKLTYPSQLKFSVNGTEMMTVDILSFVPDYPVTEEMFARPE